MKFTQNMIYLACLLTGVYGAVNRDEIKKGYLSYFTVNSSASASEHKTDSQSKPLFYEKSNMTTQQKSNNNPTSSDLERLCQVKNEIETCETQLPPVYDNKFIRKY